MKNKVYYHKLSSLPIIEVNNGRWAGKRLNGVVSKINANGVKFLVFDRSKLEENVKSEDFLTLFLALKRTSQKYNPKNREFFVNELMSICHGCGTNTIRLLRNVLKEEGAGEEAKKKGLIHLGFGYYGKKKGEAEFKSDGDKLVALSPEEKQKSKEKTGEEKPVGGEKKPITKKEPRKVKVVDKDGPEYQKAKEKQGDSTEQPTSGGGEKEKPAKVEIGESGTKMTKNEKGEFHSYNDEPAYATKEGTKVWYKDGKEHRDGDKPSYISQAGIEYKKNDKFHRDGDKPANIRIDYKTGEKTGEDYYKNGKLHRDGDKPAIINRNDPENGYSGYKEWCQNGKEHRDGDKPSAVSPGKYARWSKNGKLHRDGDKPAYIGKDGERLYAKFGVKHRDGGKPAVIKANGTKEYWEHGKKIRTEKGETAKKTKKSDKVDKQEKLKNRAKQLMDNGEFIDTTRHYSQREDPNSFIETWKYKGKSYEVEYKIRPKTEKTNGVSTKEIMDKGEFITTSKDDRDDEQKSWSETWEYNGKDYEVEYEEAISGISAVGRGKK